MSFTLSGTTITQSGTDNNLSGLSAINGITTTTRNGVTLYDFGTARRLVITGTLNHNPDTEIMLFGWTTSDTNACIDISGTGTYNFGVRTESNGRVKYSHGTGLIDYRNETSADAFWQPQNFGLLIISAGGTFNGRGGVILTDVSIGFARATNATATVNITNTAIKKVGTANSREIRFDTGQDADTGTVAGEISNLIVDGGFNITHRDLPPVFGATLEDGSINFLASGPATVTLRSISVANNQGNYDLGIDSLQGANNTGRPRFYSVIGSDAGSYTRVMPKSGVPTVRYLGGAQIYTPVTFAISNTSGSVIEGVKVYARDGNSGFRKNANNLNRTADITYLFTTDANGAVAANNILIAVTNMQTTGDFAYTDWDTNALSNCFRVDRRTNVTGSTTDEFDFKMRSYNYQEKIVRLSLRSKDTVSVEEVLIRDETVTLSEAAAGALTGITITTATGTASPANPHTITVTNAARTLDEIYAYWKWWYCQDARMDIVDQLTVTSGVLVLGNYRLVYNV